MYLDDTVYYRSLQNHLEIYQRLELNIALKSDIELWEKYEGFVWSKDVQGQY